MAIKEGDFIRLSYTGSVGDRVFDTTREDEAKTAGIHSENAIYGPVTVCVGQKHVIIGLDEELVGKKAGAEGTVTVPPEKAFGERDMKKIQSFPKNKFSEKPVRGMPVRLEEQGEGTVVDVIGNRVIVDFNAPLAGQTLTYSYKIEEFVKEPLDQLKGLIRLYAGREMEIEMDGSKAVVTLPPGINYDRRWLLWRGRIIHEGFEFIKGISEIVLVESYKKPEKKEAKTEE
ncbi:peptidylprolyl isomerase [Methanoregula sp.]|uniref:FKBP-type peptidyl-prolyl cis-trans isomerase n=1 Tax=Methanoregula sp. TaxID=2052170 RepID=UPI000CCAB774|nr:peptidylprolyl isomerase [Methanoregula sp.]PKG32510.1 MAG: peptidylprolyl isomerase [Methanoregula sp.]